MGDRELYTGHPLGTHDVLNFICASSNGPLYVGFAFGYDVTMILRDLPHGQLAKLFQPKTFEPGRSPYVWFGNFDIDYLPRNYLKVRRVRIVAGENGETRRIPVPGSLRTIYETFGFFQKSFIKAINDFNIPTKSELSIIAKNKAKRATFETIDDEVRTYCALECNLLARLMESLRAYCYEADIRPRTWNGAGKLAKALHAKFGTMTAKTYRDIIPPDLQAMASDAYYGGRFEITRVGQIGAPVYEYDINSAYPSAMLDLPCLIHGRWRQARATDLRKTRHDFVAKVSFRQADTGEDTFNQLNGLPVRTKSGTIIWPSKGSGTYWSCEIKSAEKLGMKVRYKEGWIYETDCDCHTFGWVADLYRYRKSIGKSAAGIPIKLGINSLYGAKAQRVGNGQYTNLIDASLITARTRAKLNEAIAFAPRSIIMVATDAVYSLEPLPLDVGDDLGQWDGQEMGDLFIVQPGLYWDPTKRKKKSRGLPGQFFDGPMTEHFENVWRDFSNNPQQPIPSVECPLTTFTGLRLALSRGKPDTAGRWVADVRRISYDWTGKRSDAAFQGLCLVTKPIENGGASLPHRALVANGTMDQLEALRRLTEEEPDYLDFGPPYF